MNYQQGEMYGLSGTPDRFRLRCLTPKTPIRELYLTGQDVTSLGVTGALFGGVLTASVILRRNLMETIAKEGNVRKRKTKQEIIYRGCKGQELTEQTSTEKSSAKHAAPSAFGRSSDGGAVSC